MKLVEVKLILIFISAFIISFTLVISAFFLHTNTIPAAIAIIVLMYLGANVVLMSIGGTIDPKKQLYLPIGVSLGLGLGFALIVQENIIGMLVGLLSLIILMYYGQYTRILYENQIKLYIKPLIEKQVFALSFIFAVSCAVIVFINAPEVEKDILDKISSQIDIALKSDYAKTYLENPNKLNILPDSQTLSYAVSSSLGSYSKHLIAVLSFAAFWAFEIASRIVWYFFLITLRPSFYILKKSRFIKVEKIDVTKEILTI